MGARRSLLFAFLAIGLVGALSAGMALAGKAKKTTKVTITETEYKLGFSTTKLAPGTVTFVVVNKGKLPHSLAVSGPGVKKAQLKTTVAPKKTASLTVTLKAGSYTFWCPVPGHAAAGMKTTLAVGGDTSGGGATTPPQSTTTEGGGGWA